MTKRELIEMRLAELDVQMPRSHWSKYIALISFTIMAALIFTQREGMIFGLGFIAAILAIAYDFGSKKIAIKEYWQSKLDELDD